MHCCQRYCYLEFKFSCKKISFSKFLCKSAALLAVTILTAVLNKHSNGSEVAKLPKCLWISFVKFGNTCLCLYYVNSTSDMTVFQADQRCAFIITYIYLLSQFHSPNNNCSQSSFLKMLPSVSQKDQQKYWKILLHPFISSGSLTV